MSYSFTVNVGGVSGGIYYVGYENPTLDTFNLSLLQKLDNVSILYDWETTTLQENADKDFYVVIPESEVNNIYPRWDGFTLNGNTKTYNHFASPCNTWNTRFVQLSNKNLKNVNCAIFKSIDTFKGKFYGKIQKQN